MSFFAEAKALLTIPQLAQRLGIELKYVGSRRETGDGICRSPFREDSNPSFSIFGQGTKFRDHAKGSSGDIFDFYCIAKDCSRKTSVKEIGEMLGLKTEAQHGSLPSRKVHSPSISSIPTMNYSLQKPIFDPEFFDELDDFIRRKRISDEVIIKLYREGSLSLESDKLTYHYPSGIKVRHEWESSRSTRWRAGCPGDSVWRQHELQRPEISQVVITEGESDLMRLLSFGVSDSTAVVAIPSAGWSPSPVVSGLIANGRTVILAFDNDEAGATAKQRVAKELSDNSMLSTIILFDWNDHKENDLCELTDADLSKLLALNNITL